MRKQEEAALALFAASCERGHDDILLAAPLPNVILVAERFFVDSGIVTLFGHRIVVSAVRMLWCVFVAEISLYGNEILVYIRRHIRGK